MVVVDAIWVERVMSPVEPVEGVVIDGQKRLFGGVVRSGDGTFVKKTCRTIAIRRREGCNCGD